LNAIKSPLTVSDPSNADSIEVAELMIPSTRRERLRRRANSELLLLARSKIPGVRKDIARILVELHDRNNSEILIQLAADPNKEVAIEILSHIERLPPPLAKEILTAAFSSSHTEIVTKAEEIATDLGGLE
jgi:ribosomal protein L29